MPEAERICVAVFAKAPRPHAVKTRLAPAVGFEVAAQLARAFLTDTWRLVNALDWADTRLAVAEGTHADFALDPRPELWAQGPGDLGRKLETIISRALAEFPAILVVGADAPSLPVQFVEAARAALGSSDAVLGPTDDGGFYLLGVKRWCRGVLEGIPWSTSSTFQRTRAALVRAGLRVSVLPRWFDVDRAADLERLQAALRENPGRATSTASLLAQLPARLPMSGAARERP